MRGSVGEASRGCRREALDVDGIEQKMDETRGNGGLDLVGRLGSVGVCQYKGRISMVAKKVEGGGELVRICTKLFIGQPGVKCRRGTKAQSRERHALSHAFKTNSRASASQHIETILNRSGVRRRESGGCQKRFLHFFTGSSLTFRPRSSWTRNVSESLALPRPCRAQAASLALLVCALSLALSLSLSPPLSLSFSLSLSLSPSSASRWTTRRGWLASAPLVERGDEVHVGTSYIICRRS